MQYHQLNMTSYINIKRCGVSYDVGDVVVVTLPTSTGHPTQYKYCAPLVVNENVTGCTYILEK